MLEERCCERLQSVNLLGAWRILRQRSHTTKDEGVLVLASVCRGSPFQLVSSARPPSHALGAIQRLQKPLIQWPALDYRTYWPTLSLRMLQDVPAPSLNLP